MKQIVEHKKLNPLQGILLILGLAAVLILLNYVTINLIAAGFSHISARAGIIAGLVTFWGIGGGVALQVLRVYVARVSYTLGEDVLRLCRMYGKRERHIADIYLSQLLFVGSPEDARKRYGKLNCDKALHPSCRLPATALVYRNASGTRVALIQADEDMKAALTKRVKKK